MTTAWDSIVVVSFGGPEEPDHVVPFLQNVTRGRGIPKERLEAVGQHYFLFGGRSPINEQNRALIAALREELDSHSIDLPIYFGNRNWDPYLTETVAQMAAEGRQQALAFVTSAFGSYSGCRQYREDMASACAATIEAKGNAPQLFKLPHYWNHPGFVEVMTERLATAVASAGSIDPARTRVAFTAHSIPTAWTDSSPYVHQLRAASEMVATAGAPGLAWDLVYQSRSGPPQVPWLEPDIVDHLRSLADQDVDAVLVTPIGFISDHMEVLYDLDTQAAEAAAEFGLRMIRVGTAGTHPRFVSMIRELIEEQLHGTAPLRLGPDIGGPVPCSPGCCIPPQRPAGGRNGGRPAPT